MYEREGHSVDSVLRSRNVSFFRDKSVFGCYRTIDYRQCCFEEGRDGKCGSMSEIPIASHKSVLYKIALSFLLGMHAPRELVSPLHK